MTATKSTIVISAVILCTLAISAALVGAYDWSRRLYSDGDSIRRSAALDTPRDVLWQPPRPLNELIQIAGEVYEPKLSWDGMTLYFVRGKAGANADIFTSQRTPAGWTEPQPLNDVNSEYDELGPEPSSDGASLYFYSDRPDGSGGYDIWVAHRRAASDAGGWESPVNLGAGVNSEFNEYGPALSHDGRRLYFASNRPQQRDDRRPDPNAWPATVREDWFKRTYDLYCADVAPGGTTNAAPLSVINTPANEGAPCISPSGDFLYFASDRPGGAGKFDIYRCRILKDALLPANNLGPSINTSDNELDPGLGQLGFALYFSSDRPAIQKGNSGRRYQVYFTGTREVFVEHQPTDWEALWAVTWPVLIWLLLGILTLLLLRQLIKDIRAGKLSLLARCLIASLLLHCLLLMALGYWKVQAAIGEYIGGRGPMKVTLAAAGIGGDLVAQVRGNLVTSVSTPDIITQETPRTDLMVPIQTDIRPAMLETDKSARLVDASLVTASPIDVDRTIASPKFEMRLPSFTPSVPVNTPTADRPVASSEPPPATVESKSGEITHSPMSASDAAATQSRRLDVAPKQVATDPAMEIAMAGVPSAAISDARSSSRSGSTTRVSIDAPRVSVMTLATPAAAQPAVAQSERQEASAVPVVDGAANSRAPLAAPVGDLKSQTIPPVRVEPTAGDVTDTSATLVTRLPDAAPSSTLGAQHAATQELPPTDVQLTLNLPRVVPTSQPVGNSMESEQRSVASVAPLSSSDSVLRSEPRVGMPSAAPKAVELAPTERTPTGSAAGISASPPVDVTDSKGSGGEAEKLTRRAVEQSPTSWGLLPLELAAPTSIAPPTKNTADVQSPGANTEEPRAEQDSAVRRRPLGKLFGKVTDAETKTPLADVTIRFDQAQGPALTAVSNADGTYELPVAETPDNFAVTATHDGYVPESRNVSGAQVRGRRLRLDFTLRAANESVVAVEDEPEVHHLGNDLFEGVINSQFQRKSEGAMLVGEFPLTASQAPPHLVRVTVSMMVKGLQCPPRIAINGALLPRHAVRSPEDGSFGEAIVPVDPSLLREGENQISVQAVSCTGDLDDFEFVNVQIRLTRREQTPADR